MESDPNVAANSVSKNLKLQPNSVNAVFSLPELREMIISRAVYIRVNNQPVLCRKTIPSLRHLSKDWFVSVSKVLRKDKEPLFLLLLNQENSLNGTPYVQNKGGKLLDNFVNWVYFASWYRENRPTFTLKIQEGFFRKENYNSLLNLLQKCGENLVELKLWIPKNGGSLICVFPTLSLPSLQAIEVEDRVYKTIEPQFDEGEMLVGSSLNITNLYNFLLNATTSLKKLSIQNVDFFSGKTPEGFPMLTFPATLKELKLKCEMTSEDLEILVKNQLPNLTHLYFTVPRNPFANGLVFQVLEGCKRTLEVLELFGNFPKRTPLALTLIRFPKMKQLAELKFWGINLQLETEHVLPQFNLPALKTLHLAQNKTGFRKWRESKFERVETLHLRAIDLESMQLLHQAFSNIQELDMTMMGDQACQLQYLFRDLRHLKYLSLCVEGTEIYKNSDYWDALFIGVSVELIAGLRQSPDLWETVSLDNGNMPSIRMLTGLEALTVEGREYPMNPNLLISDLTFIHAFLKMPKLRRLLFFGRFKASSKMTNIWNKLSSRITYNSFA